MATVHSDAITRSFKTLGIEITPTLARVRSDADELARIAAAQPAQGFDERFAAGTIKISDFERELDKTALAVVVADARRTIANHAREGKAMQSRSVAAIRQDVDEIVSRVQPVFATAIDTLHQVHTDLGPEIDGRLEATSAPYVRTRYAQWTSAMDACAAVAGVTEVIGALVGPDNDLAWYLVGPVTASEYDQARAACNVHTRRLAWHLIVSGRAVTLNSQADAQAIDDAITAERHASRQAAEDETEQRRNELKTKLRAERDQAERETVPVQRIR